MMTSVLTDLTDLLQSAKLPHADLTAAHLDHFVLRREGNVLVGAVGLEVVGRDALLRSLVVHPEHQNRGLGQELVRAVEAHGRSAGVTTIYLLTETAERFFAARGYASTDRAGVPEAIARTTEFATVCPASAVCMVKRIA